MVLSIKWIACSKKSYTHTVTHLFFVLIPTFCRRVSLGRLFSTSIVIVSLRRCRRLCGGPALCLLSTAVLPLRSFSRSLLPMAVSSPSAVVSSFVNTSLHWFVDQICLHQMRFESSHSSLHSLCVKGGASVEWTQTTFYIIYYKLIHCQ